jgi:hypothetical protein
MWLFSRALSAITITACFFSSIQPIEAVEAATNPLASLRQEVSADPAAAPALIAQALQAKSPVTRQWVAAVTTVVIEGLGPNPNSAKLSKVVYSAVKTLPANVLDIVRAAVIAAPASEADAIAAAAVLASPDPWQIVVYSRSTAPASRGERDFKGEPDFKGGPGDADPVGAGDGMSMTLAEAVVHAALDARPGLSVTAIYAAVDAVLRNAPGWRITAIYDPHGISGVGSAGTNNYANEPLRRKTPTLAPLPGPTTSGSPIKTRVPTTPPPVSP